jgi:hypothetical protein
MAEPITNLSLVWNPLIGISMEWTAAEDVTSSSVYNIYVYDNTLYTPGWRLWRAAAGYPERITGTAYLELAPPATYYIFPWAEMLNLSGKNLPPAAVSLYVEHVDASGAVSDMVSKTVYPPRISNPSGAPHLRNDFNINSFGEFLVNPQDSYEEISDCVSMLLGTSLGQRSMCPLFGIEELPLTMISTNDIEVSIHHWEPRANPVVNVIYDDNNNAQLNISIQTKQ